VPSTRPATCDLAAVLLLDSAHLQEEDARRANRYGYVAPREGAAAVHPADAQRAIVAHQPLAPGRDEVRRLGVTLSLTPVGTCWAPAASRCRGGRDRMVFSGDLGRQATTC
jgi:metallo-beta-lactamase family protein